MTAQKSSIIFSRVKFCVVIFAIGIISSSITAFVILGADNADSDVALMFVQSSASGTFEQKNGQKILTLVDVSSHTVYFSDRPDRITGYESTELFTTLWYEGDDSFASNPPNAVLEILDSNGQSDVFILELFNPVYDYNLETLQYNVEILAEASDGLTHYNDRNGSEIPATFENAVLFIDAYFDASYDASYDVGELVGESTEDDLCAAGIPDACGGMIPEFSP